MNETPNSQQQAPQGLPSVHLQFPAAQIPRQSASNLQILLESTKENVTQGNRAEEKVALQIILISSAVLAIVGSLGISQDGQIRLNIEAGILLVVALLGLGISLVAGVIHLILERKFWYEGFEKSVDALKIIETMHNDVDKEKAALASLSTQPRSSNRVAFWMQNVCFLVGVVSLLVILITGVIQKIS